MEFENIQKNFKIREYVVGRSLLKVCGASLGDANRDITIVTLQFSPFRTPKVILNLGDVELVNLALGWCPFCRILKLFLLVYK